MGSVARGALCAQSRIPGWLCPGRGGASLGDRSPPGGDWKAEQRHLVVGGEPAEVKYQAESHCQLLSQGTRTARVADEP